MADGLVSSLKLQNEHTTNLSSSKDEQIRLEKQLKIQAKIRARKKQTGFENNESRLNEIRENAQKEGKLINVARTADRMEAKITLEEKLRTRRLKLEKPKKKGLFASKWSRLEKMELYNSESNTELFQDLEEAAIDFIKRGKIPDTWEMLLNEIFFVSKLSEMEKARVIFHYITAQNLATIDLDTNLSSYEIKNPAQALAGLKTHDITYSTLYKHLADLSGLKCKIIEGVVKGADWNSDSDMECFKNSWNSVKINGDYYLIDAHWGSRHLSNSDTDMDICYAYEEFYFLPAADQLISTHFPDKNEFQYLKKKISREQFLQAPKKWPLFYKLGCKTVSHESSKIVSKDGSVRIEVSVGSGYRKWSQLVHAVTMDGCSFNEYVFHYQKDDCDVFEVALPLPGTYKFEICGFSPIFSNQVIVS